MEAGYRSGSKQRIRRAGSLHPVSLRHPPRRRPPLRLALARCPNLPRCKATLRLSVGPLRQLRRSPSLGAS